MTNELAKTPDNPKAMVIIKRLDNNLALYQQGERFLRIGTHRVAEYDKEHDRAYVVEKEVKKELAFKVTYWNGSKTKEFFIVNLARSNGGETQLVRLPRLLMKGEGNKYLTIDAIIKYNGIWIRQPMTLKRSTIQSVEQVYIELDRNMVN